jgi:hypothetical protein
MNVFLPSLAAGKINPAVPTATKRNNINKNRAENKKKSGIESRSRMTQYQIKKSDIVFNCFTTVLIKFYDLQPNALDILL